MARMSDSHPLSPGELGHGYSLSPIARGADGVTVAISGEIDIANAETFSAEVHSLIEGPDDQVTLDLKNCLFIDSTGIRALVVLAQEQQARGRRLKLSGVTGEPRRALGLVGLLDSGLFARSSEKDQGNQP